jgi:hypothetical protein
VHKSEILCCSGAAVRPIDGCRVEICGFLLVDGVVLRIEKMGGQGSAGTILQGVFSFAQIWL